MTLRDLLDLPPTVDLPTANLAFGIGDTLGYELAKAGDYPVPVLRIGNRYRVPTSHIVVLLGVDGLTAATSRDGAA